ncbi:MAG: energy transducer TonB [Terracidiphilus sp.]|jgi:protein TonB
MFEDSTFESTGRIRTRSRGWMIAALALNSSILLALILIPLIYPEALPRQAYAFLMAIPPPPSAPPVATHPIERASSGPSAALEDPYAAPPRIPTGIAMIRDSGPPPTGPIGNIDNDSGIPGGIRDTFGHEPPPRVVRAAPAGPVRISSGVAASTVIYKVVPVYPVIAKAAGVQGTVVLAATISKVGTIENLRVVSGPPMLQQAALDAVERWRYRPYLLNDEPVAVETTVNVVFNLQR